MEPITFFHPPCLRKWKIFLSTVMISFQSIIMWIQNKRGRVNVAIPPSSSLFYTIRYFLLCQLRYNFSKNNCKPYHHPFFQKKDPEYPSESFLLSKIKLLSFTFVLLFIFQILRMQMHQPVPLPPSQFRRFDV